MCHPWLVAYSTFIACIHSYVVTACNTTTFVHKTFGSMILQAAATAQRGGAVDVSKEDRCDLIMSYFMTITHSVLGTRSVALVMKV